MIITRWDVLDRRGQLVVQLDFVPGHAVVVAFEVNQPVSDLLSVEDKHLHVAAGNGYFRFSVDDGLRTVVDIVLVRGINR